ncbi:MAG: SdpI family protein [Cytophagia bacterium]|nr:SdpI family protein [Cytophagia bacterium]
MAQSEFILVHIMFGFSAILPAFIMQFIDTEEPNKVMGYRTKWSMKSKETWKFAQKYSSKMMWWSTLVTITVQLFSIFMLENETSIIVAVGALTLSISVAIGATERQLRLRFNKDGSPKSAEEEDLF